MAKDYIIIRGAKEHNLKGIDLQLPRNQLIVITGLSGSGKSSLAFDTLYAEGQRRYVESLSAYARQFLEQLKKPEVEYIEGLSPAISIEQRKAGSNPRSTVATQTEIYDYLRLLYARIGEPHCHICKRPISQQSAQEIVDKIMALPEDTPIHLLAPLVRGRKGEYKQLFEEIRKSGFVRARVNGEIIELKDTPRLDKNRKHKIEVIIDRISLKPEVKKRLTESVETALKVGKGLVVILPNTGKTNQEEMRFSELYACSNCGISFEELTPRMFSFNSPYGACQACDGLGTRLEIDEGILIKDTSKSVNDGAIELWKRGGREMVLYYRNLIRDAASEFGIDLDLPFKQLSKDDRRILLYGGEGEVWGRKWEGLIQNLYRRFRETDSDYVKGEIAKYMSNLPCPACGGARLRPESLAVTINGLNIAELAKLSVGRAREHFSRLKLTPKEMLIGHQILKEIKQRLDFMANVGLEYLTLDRQSETLSGGESQRIRLATQIGAGLVGVLYILDEPSIGLHQRDNKKLLDTLKTLRDLGNTLVIVEHDEETMRNADFIVDLGPGAGKHGGQVIVSGDLQKLLDCQNSLTGKYLRGELKIDVPAHRRPQKGRKWLIIKGAREHNLKDIVVKIPLGLFVCVTGVSGSGKSTLINEILYRALAQIFYGSKDKPGLYRVLEGVEHIDKVIVVDQSPIGRTPRSNPATYTGIFTFIRELFSKLTESKMRGYKPGRFSFNVKGGRCEACSGDGIKKIEMHFLPDVYVPCEVCKGSRFNEQTLQVKYKGKSISDVLKMTTEEALELFRNIPRLREKLETICEVGLGYIELGQSATTLSGGEAQRVKLSSELGKRGTGRTLYILDEPTTGLHFADIDKLLSVLQRLVDAGNTVMVIEHNLDVIKTADYIIDLGPEGGDAGGHVVAAGTPEEIAGTPSSYTGHYLRSHLNT
ncbi:MAG: excinuclease ABC subunit UvrA [Candidatus Omnitrophica bacterium]|nr:excinuclease ABC subunit UvrA [Candidatus Omnitrophota bacterium]